MLEISNTGYFFALDRFFVHQVIRLFHPDLFVNPLRVLVFLLDIEPESANVPFLVGQSFDKFIEAAVDRLTAMFG